jgi:hypothetical protein
MNDDLTLLASAYLDGDVTADERARVEADPDALAAVEQLRAVRALLSDIEPPSISVRETHLAAALSAWERLPAAERVGGRRDQTPAGIDAAAVAGAASVTAPTSVSSRPRTVSTRWLTGAAAALVLVLAGGVALQLGTSSDDDSATETDATEEVTALAADADGQRAGGDLGADELAPAGESADAAVSDVDTGVADPAPPPEDAALVQLLNLTDLADFAGAAVGAPTAPDDAPVATSAASDEDLSAAESFVIEAETPRCLGVDVIVGPAVYIDVAVVVGIDEGRNLAIAYRPTNCSEVARVRLP